MFGLKILWTIVFALLQCVVPLLHAHAGGSANTGLHTHVAPLRVAGSGEVHYIKPRFPGESIAIGVGDAHKRDVCTTCVADSHVAPPQAIEAKQSKFDFRFRGGTGACSAAPSLRLPPSHAPPARAV